MPVQWEYVVDDRVKNGREQAMAKVADSAAAVVMRALGRYGSPLGLPSIDQADEHDDRWERLASGRLGRAFESQMYARDSHLVQALGVIHAERQERSSKGRGGIRSRPYPGRGRLSDRDPPVLRRECRVAHRRPRAGLRTVRYEDGDPR